MNTKLNYFFSLFKIFFISLFKMKHFRFGKRLKLFGANLEISDRGGFILVGDSSFLSKNVLIKTDGGTIDISSNVFINRNTIIVSRGNIIIKDNVTIGPNVLIYDHNHCDERIKKQQADIIIKDGAWIGGGSIILPGVIIGKNSIIAAGSVVSKNVEDFEVYINKKC